MAGTEIIVNDPELGDENQSKSDTGAANSLVSWVIGTIRPWEDYRDANFKLKWEEYYRIWRGIWKDEDKNRESERSRLISPATAQAIEVTVSEQEEATFGKGRWFDISDDYSDEEKLDAYVTRDMLLEDMELEMFPASISEMYLNGALYGTGIAKVLVTKTFRKKPVAKQEEMAFGVAPPSLGVNEEEEVVCRLEAIPPQQFAIDPTARTIDEALGCSHTMVKPIHGILQKISKGVYRDVDIGSFEDSFDFSAYGEFKASAVEGKVKIVEYYGYAPISLIDSIAEWDEMSPEEKMMAEDMTYEIPSNLDDTDLVESIITIANDGSLLKAVKNPFVMGDRPIVAYQHDTVPNRFWGRGIAEKGYNPQKALDAELRARIDGMALAIHPMLAADATRMPRGMRLVVRPGNTLLTNGKPSDVLMPFNFGNINPNTFVQSGDLERMIQMGTGAMDSATPISDNARNQTASGMSMIASGAIKRNKRTMQNIERFALIPIINKTLWRYMQFRPKKYKPNDWKMIPRSSLGIMAREYETAQLSNMLKTTPAESPAYWLLIRGIFDNSSIEHKDEFIQIIESQLKKSQQPPEPSPAEQMQMKSAEMSLKAQELSIIKMQQDAMNESKKVRVDSEEANIKRQEADTKRFEAKSKSILDVAKARAEKRKLELQEKELELNHKEMMFNAFVSSMSNEESEDSEEGKEDDVMKKFEAVLKEFSAEYNKPKELIPERDDRDFIKSVRIKTES